MRKIVVKAGKSCKGCPLWFGVFVIIENKFRLAGYSCPMRGQYNSIYYKKPPKGLNSSMDNFLKPTKACREAEVK